MNLAAGTTLAHYCISAELGSGGMGEVWRAEDTKLGREVALKVLPEEFARDPERMARFEREAKVLASLNHPNIATLYGLETTPVIPSERSESRDPLKSGSDSSTQNAPANSGGPSTPASPGDASAQDDRKAVTFLAMELVEGEDLSERIKSGPMPVEDAVPIALQIAEALEAAHEQGIVHRDLKPANIKITDAGAVKVLDFGLAKTLLDRVTADAMSEEPTVTARGTEVGVVLGTAAYMSPEQARGRPADTRTDIWSFGVVLWEMLSGRRLFDGSSAADVRAAVLTDDLDDDLLPAETPRPLREMLGRCLERDPRRRLRHVGDARLVLEDIVAGRVAEAPPHVTTVRRSRLPWAIAGAAILAAAVLTIRPQGDRPAGGQDRKPVQFEIALPEGSLIYPGEITTRIAVSPDGTQVAFTATSAGGNHVFVRRLDSLELRRIPGTGDATSPFWSPDGTSLGFFSRGRLMRVDIAGGPPRGICEAQLEGRAAWGPNGTILFGELGAERSGLSRVGEDGGALEVLTSVDRNAGEVAHLWPQFLPDQNRVLYLRLAKGDGGAGIERHMMAVSADGGSPSEIMPLDSRFELTPSGHLLFVRDGSLLAQPFDTGALRLEGRPVTVADNLNYLLSTGSAEFSASSTGVVAVHGGQSETEIVRVDRKGSLLAAVAETAAHGLVRLAPGGGRLAMEIKDPTTGARDIWVHDLGLGTARRITLSPADDTDPVWWPDGSKIVYASDMRGAPDVYERGFDEGAEVLLLAAGPGVLEPDDIDPTTHRLLYTLWSRATSADLWLAGDDPGDVPTLYLQTPYAESWARYSRDGRWLAFVSDETGTSEVYVASATDAETRRRISASGGFAPLWRGDGRELFFLSQGRVIRASIDPRSGAPLSAPEPLFEIEGSVWGSSWDVAPDGRQFILNRTVRDRRREPLRIILDWPALTELPSGEGVP